MSEQGSEGTSSGDPPPISGELAGQQVAQPATDQNERDVGAVARHDQNRDLPSEPLVTVTENIVPGKGRIITEFVARQVVDQYVRWPERGGRGGDGGNHGGDARNGGAHGGDDGGGRNRDPPRITQQSPDRGISGGDESQTQSNSKNEQHKHG